MARLSHHDRNTSAWQHVKRHAENEIDRMRGELEKTTRSHDETMVYRGQIKALRSLVKEMEQGQEQKQ